VELNYKNGVVEVGNILSLQNLSIEAGDRALLSDINLEFGKTGLFAIMGPVGVGKSTLLSVFSGIGNGNGLQIDCDGAEYCKAPLNTENHPIVIKQATRSEQAQRAIDGGATIRSQIYDSLAQNPKLLCLDEPTAGVAHSEALSMLNWLKEESRRRAIIMVTHNSEQARYFADWVVLLGGGKVVEQGPTAAFFDNPQNPVTKHFIKTGSLSIPRLDAHPRQLAPEYRGIPEGISTRTVGSTDGKLNWIIRRSFAIAHHNDAKKGKSNNLVSELLEKNIDTAVISSDTTESFQKSLHEKGIKTLTFSPSSNAGPREIRSYLELAEQIDATISKGNRIAVIERGNDHTEILAAVQLIFMGITANDAIDLLNSKKSGLGIATHDEQFLWDLELVLDLSASKDQSADNKSNTQSIEFSKSEPVKLAYRVGN
jgi:ABC-type multidrug transport system ATPase subunit